MPKKKAATPRKSLQHKTVGIIGYGEIGKAIGYCYFKKRRKFAVSDPKLNAAIVGQVDVLHICLPNHPRFPEEAVIKAVKDHGENAIVIIHSTVEPGTTERLRKQSGHRFIVHSPVLGVHPNLAPALLTFEKWVGADDSGAARLAVEELRSIGINATARRGSKVTEFAKLACLLQRSVSIALHDILAQWSEKEGVSFDTIIDWNHLYNKGYWKMNMPEVIRPIVYAPNGKIGGHCQIPAAKILKKRYGGNGFIDEVLKLA